MMIDLFALLKSRNEPLFYFGLICLLSAVFTLLIAKFSESQINGVNTWYKPFKFALSIGTFCWTMGWYTGYLELPDHVSTYSWTTIILLGFELFYITFHAARGQLSHYNVSSSLYTSLTAAMAFAAMGATLYTGYIGILFCTGQFPALYLKLSFHSDRRVFTGFKEETLRVLYPSIKDAIVIMARTQIAIVPI